MKIIAVLLFALLGVTVYAQSNSKEAKAVLDKTSKTIRNSGDMEVNFTASTFMEQSQKGNLSGTIYLKGRKFNIVSTNVLCWFDGKTLWSFNKANDEVNVSTPSVKERQSMDPYLFCELYKDGYTYEMSDTSLRGHDCHEVRLKTTDKRKSVQEMIITIDKKTSMPLCVRMRQGVKYWIRISTQKCKINQKYDNDKFKFNSEDYPSATVVDIR
jgi:outer membrane lipoprotein-sorting protein